MTFQRKTASFYKNDESCHRDLGFLRINVIKRCQKLLENGLIKIEKKPQINLKLCSL